MVTVILRFDLNYRAVWACGPAVPYGDGRAHRLSPNDRFCTVVANDRCPGPWQECHTDRRPVDGDGATTCHQPAEEGTCGSSYIRVVRVPRSQPRDIPVTIVST